MEADNLSLTRKERRAKANREASLKKPIVSPLLTKSPFDFIFFTWFGPILRLVSIAYYCAYTAGNHKASAHCNALYCRVLRDPFSMQICPRCQIQSKLKIAIQNSGIVGIAF